MARKKQAVRTESRSVTVTAASPNFLEIFGLTGTASVSMEEAIGVPAIWAAVNFYAGTLAGLPLHVYDKTANGKKRVKPGKLNPVVGVLHDAANDGLTSFQWRYDLMVAVLTEGRSVTYIERDDRGQPINLFPLPGATVKMMSNGRKEYTHKAGGKTTVYDQADVIDIAFMLKADLVTHRSPLRQCAVAIGKMVHANEYGGKLFKNGGLPAFALTGPFSSGKAAERAGADIAEATREAARKGANVLAIPLGHELKPLGSDPEKMQAIEAQRFGVQEAARIYNLPPSFLQELSEGIRADVEQQDIHLAKHSVKRWCEQVEAELNLKLFGRGSSRIVEYNLDGLMRGAFVARMEGQSRAIQTGQLTPNEARALDNREPLEGGDVLLIQGGTVPLAGHTGQEPPAEQEEPSNAP